MKRFALHPLQRLLTVLLGLLELRPLPIQLKLLPLQLHLCFQFEPLNLLLVQTVRLLSRSLSLLHSHYLLLEAVIREYIPFSACLQAAIAGAFAGPAL